MYKTAQEAFWAGEFGDEYTRRNAGDLLAANMALFSKILFNAGPISSVLELGANVGDNLRAIKTLMPKAQLSAVEINHSAAELLKATGANVFEGSLFDYKPTSTFDLVLLKGVLIHIDPAMLERAYDVAFNASSRHICIAEYYSTQPISLPYRGHANRLFKRDFAGEMLDRYPLSLRDYGFSYHRGVFPQDDITWFLLTRR